MVLPGRRKVRKGNRKDWLGLDVKEKKKRYKNNKKGFNFIHKYTRYFLVGGLWNEGLQMKLNHWMFVLQLQNPLKMFMNILIRCGLLLMYLWGEVAWAQNILRTLSLLGCWGEWGSYYIQKTWVNTLSYHNKFKSLIRLCAFHFMIMPFRSAHVLLFSLQRLVNSRADCVLYLGLSNQSRRKTHDSNQLYSA